MALAIRFEILEGHKATEAWVEDVRKASDAHRNELGFLARSVFDEFSRRDGLYVLVAETNEGRHYAGHVLFDRHFPRAHVRQIFVIAAFRRYGAASRLLDHLRHSLTQSGFISIYARVAEDLVHANAFWQRQLFYIQRSIKGGASRNRQILVRCHELESPQLFPTSGLNDLNPLGLQEPLSNEIPLYLLDMNVLFDVHPRRPRRKEIVGLFQAERMNFCRLAISSEVREELRRNLAERQTDPMDAYVDMFPCLPIDQRSDTDANFSALAALAFPSTLGERPLNVNERSDIRHVLTAIQHNLAGLITNDAALLNVASEIESTFGIQILPSSAFELDESVSRSEDAFETRGRGTLRLLTVLGETEATVREFLGQKMGLSGSGIATSWLPIETQGRIATRCAVWSDDSCVGYLTWPALLPTDSTVAARAAVDESHPQAIEAARILLLHLLDRLRTSGPCQVKVELAEHQSHLREVGAILGFAGSPKGKNHLIKSMLGMVLTPETWHHCQSALTAKGGPRLPAKAPTYVGPDQHLVAHTPDGNRAHVTLDRLESLLAPTLFLLPGRPAIISPVRRTYAEPLLGHSLQGSLLPHASASLYTDRIYISQPSSLKHFKRGVLMFFYESGRDGGRSQIVAIGRVREAYLKACDAFDASDLNQSVLTTKNLRDIGSSPMKTVTIFDNIFALPNPVDLRTLQDLGCGRPTDLITTHAISDSQTQEILIRGFGRV